MEYENPFSSYTNEDIFGNGTDKGSKLDTLSQRKDDKISRLSGKVVKDGYVYNADNKYFNEFSDADAMGMLGTVYSEEGLYKDPEGRVRKVKDDSEYTGNTNWLYGYKTKDPELDAYKVGFSREDDPAYRYDQERHPDWEFGSQGADTERVDGRMELLFPEDVAVPMEAMLHGRETALDNRWFRQREDGKYEAPQGYIDFGSGGTEVYTSPEGVFGDSRDDQARGRDELLGMFRQVQQGVYGQDGTEGESLEEAAARFKAERLAKEREESPVWTETKQLLAGSLAGVGKGAVDLADVAQELVTWGPQTAVRMITGDDKYDIDLISEELKKDAIEGIDDVVGYDRAYYDQVMEDAKNDLQRAGVDITSWDAMKEAVTDPEKRKYLSEATLSVLASPAMLASMITEIVGAGGLLGAGTKLGAKVVSKVAPKISAKVAPALTSNISKIRTELSAARKAKDAGRIAQLEGSYTLAKRIPDLLKGTVYTNADMAIRVNEDIDAYTENNDGEAPDAAKILQIVALDRLASSAEIGSLKMAANVGELTQEALESTIRGVTGRLAKEIGKSVSVEAAQETFDGIVQQINQKLGSEQYKDMSLGEILEETSAEILTGTIAGAATGGYVSTGAETLEQLTGAPEKLAERAKVADAKRKSVKREEMSPEKINPEDTSYEDSYKYNYNRKVTSGSNAVGGSTEGINKVLFDGQGESVLSDEDRTPEQKVNDVAELVEIASEGGIQPTERMDALVDSVTRVTGQDRGQVERRLLNAQNRGRMVGLVAKEDPEAAKLLKQAENAYAARDSEAIEAVLPELEVKVEELGSTVYSELAGEFLGDRVARAEAETKSAARQLASRADTLASEVVSANRENRAGAAKRLATELEDGNYVLGSSQKALDMIGVLYETSGNSSSLVNKAIDRLAKENNVTAEELKALKKTFDSVRKEATKGAKGYESYGKTLDELYENPEENGVMIAQLADRARYFYGTQQRAAQQLQEGIDRAVDTRKNPLESNEPIVTEYVKSDGTKFDIRTDSNGVALKTDVDNAKKFLSEKKANMRGIEENVLSKVDSPVKRTRVELPEVTEESAKEPAKKGPVWSPEVAEGVRQAVREGVDKDILVERLGRVNKLSKASAERAYNRAKELVREEQRAEKPAKKVENKAEPKTEKKVDIVDVVRFIEDQRGQGVNDLTSKTDQDGLILDIMTKLGVTKTEATSLYNRASKENEESKPDGKILKDLIRNNVSRKKVPVQVDSKGMFKYIDGQKGVMATIERNIANVVKVGRPTTLNSVNVDNDKTLVRMASSAKDALGKVIKPFMKNEFDGEKGGFESVSSPSRAMIFNDKGEMNSNVVTAMYAAVTEAMNIDGYMLSPYRKTSADIADMMGITEEEVTPELVKLIGDKGMLMDTLVNSLGSNVASLLGLAPKNMEGVDLQNYPRLVADLGNAALHIGVGQGLLKVVGDVKAKELSEALGNEAINDEARVNFVQFTEDGLSSRELIGKRAKKIAEAVTEISELRPKPKMEEFTRAEINSYKNKIRRDMAEQEPTELVSKAIEKAMKTEWQLDIGLAAEVLANKTAVMKQSGYIAEGSEEFSRLSVEDKESQLGINDKVTRDMDALEELVNGNRNKKSVSMWFAHYTGRNGRLYMESSTVNPMNEKNYHRWVIQPKDMETSYSVSKEGSVYKFEHEGEEVTGLINYAVAQALGFSVDKKDTTKINRFAEKVMGLNRTQLKGLKSALLDGKTYDLGDGFTAESEHIGHVLQGLKFVDDVVSGKEVVTSKLSAEFDAVTSGFGLKLMQLPIIRNLYEYMAKVGVVVPSKLVDGTALGDNSDAESMNDYLDREGVLDNYQTLAQDVETPNSLNGLISNAEQVSKSEKGRVSSQLRGMESLWKDMREVLPQKVNGEVSSALRNLFKYPFMTFNYARSVRNIKLGLAADITRDLIGKIAKEDLSEGSNAGLRKVAHDLSKLVGKDIQVLLRETHPRDIQVGNRGSLQEVLETMMLYSYGTEVERVFNEQFGEFASAQDKITDSFKFVYEVFNKMYTDETEKARKLNKGRVLTEKENKEIVKKLLKVFPVIAGPASNRFESVPGGKASYDDGIAIVRQRKVGKDDKWYKNTQFQTVSNELTGNTVSKVANIQMKTFEVPGVAGVVIPIHFTDAAILMNTYMDSENGLMTIHDAVIPKLVDAPSVVGKYNENTVKVNREYSFVEAVNDMVNRTRNALNEMGSEDKAKVRGIELGWKPSFVDSKEWDKGTKILGDYWDSMVTSMDELATVTSNGRLDVINAIDAGDAKVMHMAGLGNMVYNTVTDTEALTVDRLDERQTDDVFESLFGKDALELINCLGKGD